MKHVPSCLLILALAIPGLVPAAVPETLIEDCDGCHGPQGVSTDSDVPSIAGQASAYIGSSLRSYKEWGRPCRRSAYRHGDTSRPETTMCAASEGLSSEDIETLGNYYSELAFVAAKQDFDPASAAAGAKLHEVHCESCHAEGGTVPGRGPILAGQWAPYLKVAAREALTGEHLVPPLMEKQLSDFSNEELDDLMNFYASQQGPGSP